MNSMRQWAGVLMLCLIWSLTLSARAAEAEGVAVRRFGLIVGANNGGPGRSPLRYADSDARAMAELLEAMGGLPAADRILLLEPTRESLATALNQLGQRIAAGRAARQRTELLLYFSGHSDEEGLLLGRERFSYPDLRRALDQLPADVRIAILDSCASGALLRAKGGRRRPPFQLDASSRVRGHAFLTSSAEDEASQESDRIRGSFFTQALITGLRGAADVTRDGRVTLNEAYQFAFHETLTRTERTAAGPQHPTYDIRLAGTGDLVLTDLRTTSSLLRLAGDLAGRLFIHDEAGRLIVELRLTGGAPLDLGFEPGRYRVSLRKGGQLLEAGLSLEAGRQELLELSRFKPVTSERTALRGAAGGAPSSDGDTTGAAASSEAMDTNRGETDSAGEDREEAMDDGLEVDRAQLAYADSEDWDGSRSREADRVRILPAVVSFVPPLSTNPRPSPDESSRLSIGILISHDNRIQGAAMSSVLTWVDNQVSGVQLSGAVNQTGGPVAGVQAAGAFNSADGVLGGGQLAGGGNLSAAPVHGVQAAGGVNIAAGGLQGGQAAGGANIVAGAVRGIQLAGGANLAHGGMRGVQAAGAVNLASGGFRASQGGGPTVSSGSMTGLQLAGGINLSSHGINGLQLGSVNISGGDTGSQIGAVNISSGRVRGLQLGVVNIADDAVAPIGVISIVKKGYHTLGVWGDEMRTVRVGVKTGGRLLYNHLAVGIGPGLEGDYLISSLGLGAHLGGPHVFADLELLANGFERRGDWRTTTGVVSLRLEVGVKMLPFLAVVAGPSLNLMTTVDGASAPALGFTPRWRYQSGSTAFQCWPGISIGLQL